MLTLTLLFIGAVAFLIAGFEGVAWTIIILGVLFAFFGLFMVLVNTILNCLDKPNKKKQEAKFIADNE